MFKEKGMAEEEVLRDLNELLAGDATYSSGHPIASMSTIPHQLGVDVFSKTLEKNAGRLHTFKGSAKVEQQVIQMLGDLLHLESPSGTTTSGGTESNMLAMLAARESAPREVKNPVVIAPKTVHASIDKAAWLMGVRLVKTEVDEEFRAITSGIEEKIDKNTIAIFCTAGTTYLGQVDPIAEIGAIAKEKSIPLHVDAAFGGFVIPFLEDVGYPSYDFDFKVEGVTSVSTDPHKMGMAPIPAGSILFRGQKMLDMITRQVPYLRGASAKQASLLGTRPASSILATWAIMRHLGRQGYRELVKDCMKRTEHAYDRIRQNLMIEAAIEPVMNILGIMNKERSLDETVEEMEKRGWRMATSPIPPTMRLVVMPHVTEGAINAFFNDLDVVTTTIPAD
jgi:tyrosine decarboxylase/aspartate 1-decarboxylase